MLSKEEKSTLNHQFWGQFKKLMKPCLSSDQKQINWLNYPTHLKHTYLRLVFDSNGASLCYDVQFRDEEIRALYWEQLEELRSVINTHMNSPGYWQKEVTTDEGLSISRIKWEQADFRLFNKNDWKEAQEFLKDRLLEFDGFYGEYKDILIHLIK